MGVGLAAVTATWASQTNKCERNCLCRGRCARAHTRAYIFAPPPHTPYRHELATAEEDVDERMREIQRVAKSVEDLAVLFKELATLVVEQGTILDRIDVNMETAVVHVKKGLESIQEADKYQKKAGPIKCMLILMVLIVIMTIVIIVRKS